MWTRSYLKDVGGDSDKTIEKLGAKVDGIGGSLRENIEKVVGCFSNSVGTLKRNQTSAHYVSKWVNSNLSRRKSSSSIVELVIYPAVFFFFVQKPSNFLDIPPKS